MHLLADPQSLSFENRLINSLRREERVRVEQTLECVHVERREVLHHAAQPMAFVYFPTGGFCSLVMPAGDGGMVEVATVGREGAIGLKAVVHPPTGLATAMVQNEGPNPWLRMRCDAYRAEMDRRGSFYILLTHYTLTFLGAVMVTTACNAVHGVEQRLARWLLVAQDRLNSTDVPLTQDFMAMMLGVSRPTLSLTAASLQKAGLITYRRGVVTIVDRARLETTSCDCYRTSRRLFGAV